MKQKPLIETNPYLRDPEKFRKALITNVSSSTAVETGASVESIARTLRESGRVEPQSCAAPHESAPDHLFPHIVPACRNALAHARNRHFR